MAGAGYKLFATGDVLTAAQVNTYLQEQTVMVFASAAARTTALSGVVAEGMMSYLTDTDVVQYYNGTTWTTINTDQTPLTTKGDLFTYSTQDARLAVGNNGETLVADSSATTGLRWQSNFAAGKNKIINGDFNINQRNFTSNTTSFAYNFDRFAQGNSGGTVTVTPQTFTAGTAPVSGYEAKNFVRIVSASQSASGNYAGIVQKIESVRTFANQTVTFSFWAKASTGTPNIGVAFTQTFGSGGSPSADVYTGSSTTTITTSWARYSFTVSVPSISGKTLGTAGDDCLIAWIFTSAGTTISALGFPAVGVQNVTVDIWGVQVEAGSVATAFQTATGTLAGELAACQRYYWRNSNTGSGSQNYTLGLSISTSAVYFGIQFPVTMRTAPATLDYSGVQVSSATTGYSGGTTTQVANQTSASASTLQYAHTSAALTSDRSYLVQIAATTGYIGFSAEL